MKHLKLFLIFVVLLTIGTTAYGQNVTVSPNTGSLIAALTTGTESGFENGWSAMWRHEQLPLTFTVSDFCNTLESGELRQPAGNMKVYNGRITLAGGSNPDSYMCLSLPNGYRITGYTIVLANDVVNARIPAGVDQYGRQQYSTLSNTGNKIFYETDDLSYNSSTLTMDYNQVSDQNQYNTIRNEIIANNAHYLAVARNANENFVMAGSNETNYYTITRESKTDDDMGNRLYFRLSHSSGSNLYGVSIVSFEVRFTAEGTFEADVKPDDIGNARSVVQAPFHTSKIDIGDMKVEEKNGQQYFAYNYNNVRDLTAYNTIYQSNAVQNGIPTEGTEAKTIFPVKVDGQELFAFGNNTYYAETPIQVHTQSGLEAPVGYRIVGARFNYLWGTATGSSTEERTSYYITYTSGGTTYYLNDQLHFTTNKFAWSYDSSNQNIYTGSGDNIRYLSCTGSGATRTLTFSTTNGGGYNLQVFTRNGNTYIGWPEMNYTSGWIFTTTIEATGYVVGNTTGATATMVRNDNSNGVPNNAANWVVETETVTIPAFAPGSYTLKVYDKEGKYEEGTDGKPTKGMKAVVTSEEDAGGILELENLNNDAVKFEISGLAEDKQALVSVTLLLQALDPYIDNMNIVCHDADNQLTLSKPFTADDFSVSGGKFIFYIPQEYQNTELTFSFSDLYSHYGDATYPGGSNEHFGRYSFVTSDYFTPINGNGNDGLYDSAYNPDTTYHTKVVTSKAGNIRFKFNNAEDLGNNGTGTGYLEETPFSVADYLGSEDPDGTTNPDGTIKTGDFIDCKLKASEESQRSGIYYVFTADETRYNIAPTKAWQHRSYAFYRMDIELQAKTYTPDLVWEKIYDTDKTYYDNGKTNSQWGLKLQTKDGNKVVTGYLTVKEILDAIDARTADDSAAPAGKDQILYIDGSELYSIINSSIKEGESTTTLDLSNLKEGLGKNAIIFLPENTTSTLDNFAYKTSSGSFRAGKDIVLTDKQPFYSPYDVQVDRANIAKYERLVTNAKNGKVTAASIILPFEILVDDEGAHTNADGTKAFSLHQMLQNGNCLSDTAPADVAGGDNDVTYAFFPNIQVAKTTVPNTPYVVKVLKQDEGTNTSFVVTQNGSLIKATTGMNATDYTFTGESATGTSARGETATGETTYNFTSKGTYSGVKIAKGEGVFYFAQNKFVNSNDLDSAHPFVKGQPFRAFYATSNSKSLLPGFEIYFGEGNGTPTGITDVTKRIDTGIKGGKGTITISSAIDNNVKIYNTSGMHFMNVDMQAGETKTVNVPAGIYVVNGVKIIVK